jgi:chaperonin GroES
MATNIKPLHDRVIVRRLDESSNQTAGGLFIPDSAKEKPQEGEVIAAGDGKYKENGERQALDVKAGACGRMRRSPHARRSPRTNVMRLLEV